MRRKGQQLSPEESLELLNKGSSGTLALLGDDGYPYAVPLSYVPVDNILYFHSAPTGHKVDAIENHPKASFCVVDMDLVLPEKLTTCYRSVIAFGEIRRVTDPEEVRAALKALAEKYSPEYPHLAKEEIRKFQDKLCILRLDIEHLTGKQAIELKNK